MMNITLYTEPRSKKNHQQIIRARGHYMVIPSKQYKEYEKACGVYLDGLLAEPIDRPVEVKCLYYMQTHRRCDLTNLLEATDDILVKYGVLADDNFNIIASHDGSRVLYDKENPRTEIYIREYEDKDV